MGAEMVGTRMGWARTEMMWWGRRGEESGEGGRGKGGHQAIIVGAVVVMVVMLVVVRVRMVVRVRGMDMWGRGRGRVM